MADPRLALLGFTTGAMLSMLAAPALGQPVQLRAGLDNRFSDNVRRAAAGNETQDIETRFDLGVDYRSDPARCNLAVSGDFGYAVWQRNSYGPKLYTTMDANSDCELANNLVWQLSDTLRNVTRNTQAVATPNNIIRKNVFRTGPQYTLRLGPRDQLQLSAQYEVSRYSQSSSVPGSDRIIGSAAWNHLVSETFSAGLRVSTDRAKLVSGGNIDRNTASLTFGKHWQATKLDGSIGASNIDTRIGGAQRNTTAAVGSIDITRQINRSADLYLNASRELTDRTSSFAAQYAGFAFNQQRSGGVRVLAVRLGVNKRFSDGSSLDTSLSSDRSTYLQSGYREDRNGIDIRYTRPITGLVRADASAGFGNRRYALDNRSDRLIDLSAGLTYQATRRFSVVGRVGRNARRSDAGGPEYNENWVLLGVDARFL